MPGVAQVVSISVGHSDQGLNGVNILLLHLCDAGAGCKQGESGQSLNIGISLQLPSDRTVTTHSWIHVDVNNESSRNIITQHRKKLNENKLVKH